jgi:cytochrome c-type biogenesis protein CcmH/NrfG
MLAGHVRRLDGDAEGAERAWQEAQRLAPEDPAPAAALELLRGAVGDPDSGG